jgi:hypothetical protein
MRGTLLNSSGIKKNPPNVDRNPLLEKEEIATLLKMGFKVSGIYPDDITFIYSHGSKTDLEYQDLQSVHSKKSAKLRKELEKKNFLKLEKSILKGDVLQEREFMMLKYYLRNNLDKLSYYTLLMCDYSENIIDKTMIPELLKQKT